ncbi:DUF4123 domain-containing protein [Acinetobacter bereziniae]|uniref:DUF4123 domain-containing protein n=1 Tax=Acinetobacter bereziniae TaxID=106648 RepID=UPI00124C3A81|nr:DUF4123 domain-containing protein [Acinetobacter bereziniae]
MKREIIPFKQIQRCIEDYQHDLNMYLILDAAQVSDQALSFIHEFQNDSRIEFYSLFSGTTEGNAPFEVAPVLLLIHDLDLFNDERFNFIHQTWKDEQALNIVLSSLDLTQFVKKMKSYLTVEFPDGTQKLFRWFDPRIIKKIHKILQDEQVDEFFQGIERWVIAIRNYQDVYTNQLMILEHA